MRKKEDAGERRLKGYTWDGEQLTETFSIDFYAEKLGRSHQIRFGAYSLYAEHRDKSDTTRKPHAW